MVSGLSIDSPLVRVKPVDVPNGMTSRPPLRKSGNRSGSPTVTVARSTVMRSIPSPAVVPAWIEAENQAAEYPLAGLDIEIQLRRVQQDVVGDNSREVLSSAGDHFEGAA